MNLKKLQFYMTHVRKIGYLQALRQATNEIRRRIARPAALAGFPDALHIEISNACNLSREYCMLKNSLRGQKTMTLETFELLKPFVKYVRSISLSGLAEPLVNKNLVQILHEIKHISPQCQVNILSNATLLNEDLCQKLLDEQLDYFGFSLDGVESEATDAIRKGGTLASVLKNIANLNEAKKARKRSLTIIYATTVLQKKNYRQLPEIVRLAAGLGVAKLDVNGLEPYSEEILGNELWSSPSVCEDLPTVLHEAAQVAEKLDLDLRMAGVIPSKPACPAATTPIILANGDVVPCAVLAYSRDCYFTVDTDGKIERETSRSTDMCFGNIHDHSLPEIWFSPGYAEFRRKALSGDFPPACRTCLVKHGIICVRDAVSAREVIGQLAALAEKKQ